MGNLSFGRPDLNNGMPLGGRYSEYDISKLQLLNLYKGVNDTFS